jgi:hypothetical protein
LVVQELTKKVTRVSDDFVLLDYSRDGYILADDIESVGRMIDYVYEKGEDQDVEYLRDYAKSIETELLGEIYRRLGIHGAGPHQQGPRAFIPLFAGPLATVFVNSYSLALIVGIVGLVIVMKWMRSIQPVPFQPVPAVLSWVDTGDRICACPVRALPVPEGQTEKYDPLDLKQSDTIPFLRVRDRQYMLDPATLFHALGPPDSLKRQALLEIVGRSEYLKSLDKDSLFPLIKVTGYWDETNKSLTHAPESPGDTRLLSLYIHLFNLDRLVKFEQEIRALDQKIKEGYLEKARKKDELIRQKRVYLRFVSSFIIDGHERFHLEGMDETQARRATIAFLKDPRNRGLLLDVVEVLTNPGIYGVGADEVFYQGLRSLLEDALPAYESNGPSLAAFPPLLEQEQRLFNQNPLPGDVGTVTVIGKVRILDTTRLSVRDGDREIVVHVVYFESLDPLSKVTSYYDHQSNRLWISRNDFDADREVSRQISLFQDIERRDDEIWLRSLNFRPADRGALLVLTWNLSELFGMEISGGASIEQLVRERLILERQLVFDPNSSGANTERADQFAASAQARVLRRQKVYNPDQEQIETSEIKLADRLYRDLTLMNHNPVMALILLIDLFLSTQNLGEDDYLTAMIVLEQWGSDSVTAIDLAGGPTVEAIQAVSTAIEEIIARNQYGRGDFPDMDSRRGAIREDLRRQTRTAGQRIFGSFGAASEVRDEGPHRLMVSAPLAAILNGDLVLSVALGLVLLMIALSGMWMAEDHPSKTVDAKLQPQARRSVTNRNSAISYRFVRGENGFEYDASVLHTIKIDVRWQMILEHLINRLDALDPLSDINAFTIKVVVGGSEIIVVDPDTKTIFIRASFFDQTPQYRLRVMRRVLSSQASRSRDRLLWTEDARSDIFEDLYYRAASLYATSSDRSEIDQAEYAARQARGDLHVTWISQASDEGSPILQERSVIINFIRSLFNHGRHNYFNYDSRITFDEYTRMTYILWEDIDTICEYPYEDNWENKGEKFFIEARGKQMLILGSLEGILLDWAQFRMLYGPHQSFPGEPITLMYTLKHKQEDSAANGVDKS